MLKERVAYLAVLLCLFSVVNKSLAQLPSAYSNIEVHTLRDIETKNTRKTKGPNSLNIGFLSQPKLGLKSAQSGNKALFVSQTQCEIYDFDAQEWVVKTLAKPRRNISVVSAAHITYLAGGCTGPVSSPEYSSKIDIYNSTTNNWKTAKLSVPRVIGAATSVGSKIILAGGLGEHGLTDIVDVYDVQNNKHETYHLSEARTGMAVTTIDNRVIFAGGTTSGNLASAVIDIFDLSTGNRTTEKLSQTRTDMAIATSNNCIIFAGGMQEIDGKEIPSAKVEVYNVATGKWQQLNLSEAKSGISVAVTGNKVYFAGGILNDAGALSDKIEILEVATGSMEIHILEATRSGMAVGITTHKVLFAGGSEKEEGVASDRIEILDIETGEWQVERLYQPRMNMACASYNNKVIFAGGTTTTYPFPEYKKASGVVDIYTDPAVTLVSKPDIIDLPCIYTDSGTYVYLDITRYRNCAVDVTILNASRETLFSVPVLPSKYQLQEIDVKALEPGNYYVLAEAPGYHPLLRSFSIEHTLPKDIQPPVLAVAFNE